MTIVREGAQVVDLRVHQARLARAPNNTVIERAGEKFRKNRDEIKLHGRHSVPQRDLAAIQILQSFRQHNVNAF